MQSMTKQRSKNLAARRPAMGSWHTITEQAKKVRHKNTLPKIVQWHAFDIEPVNAMYTGYRYKFNGHLVVTELWGIEDWESYGFITEESVEVWMFVIHPHQNPITVFPFEYPENESNDPCIPAGETDLCLDCQFYFRDERRKVCTWKLLDVDCVWVCSDHLQIKKISE